MPPNNNDLYSSLSAYAEKGCRIDIRHYATDVLNRLNNGAFISYSQNFEDVMLNRVFKNKENGFYIDVGAFHPIHKSTTCALYKRGWHGINIDISKENIINLKKHRIRDENVCAAIGANKSIHDFFMIEGTTRSTSDAKLAAKYVDDGTDGDFLSIETTSLTSICNEHQVKNIDLLSIDVEGMEKDVLSSLDFKEFQPTIVLVESTYPETSVPTWDAWDHLLTNHNYACPYFDGLNRFYIHGHQPELESHFKIAPNYFDNFIRYTEIDLILSFLELENKGF